MYYKVLSAVLVTKYYILYCVVPRHYICLMIYCAFEHRLVNTTSTIVIVVAVVIIFMFVDVVFIRVFVVGIIILSLRSI